MELLLLLIVFLWSITQIDYESLKIHKRKNSKKYHKENDIVKIVKIINGKKEFLQVRIIKRMKTINTITYLVETLINKEQYIITQKDIV